MKIALTLIKATDPDATGHVKNAFFLACAEANSLLFRASSISSSDSVEKDHCSQFPSMVPSYISILSQLSTFPIFLEYGERRTFGSGEGPSHDPTAQSPLNPSEHLSDLYQVYKVGEKGVRRIPHVSALDGFHSLQLLLASLVQWGQQGGESTNSTHTYSNSAKEALDACTAVCRTRSSLLPSLLPPYATMKGVCMKDQVENLILSLTHDPSIRWIMCVLPALLLDKEREVSVLCESPHLSILIHCVGCSLFMLGEQRMMQAVGREMDESIRKGPVWYNDFLYPLTPVGNLTSYVQLHSLALASSFPPSSRGIDG